MNEEKSKKLFNSITNVREDFIEEAQGWEGKKKSKAWMKWAAIAASFALLLSIGIPMLKKDHDTDFVLSVESVKVGVKYVEGSEDEEGIHSATTKSELVGYTEEEMFSMPNIFIFKGTVEKIANIAIDFNGYTEYRALAEIKVDKVYGGSISKGDRLTVLVPCPINGKENYLVEDTDVVKNLRAGMTGIFMPIIYDSEAYWQQNDATLMLKDIADCGFGDGMRWMFLETEKGLVFERYAYASIANAKTLDEVEEYVMTMINK